MTSGGRGGVNVRISKHLELVLYSETLIVRRLFWNSVMLFGQIFILLNLLCLCTFSLLGEDRQNGTDFREKLP